MVEWFVRGEQDHSHERLQGEKTKLSEKSNITAHRAQIGSRDSSREPPETGIGRESMGQTRQYLRSGAEPHSRLSYCPSQASKFMGNESTR